MRRLRLTAPWRWNRFSRPTATRCESATRSPHALRATAIACVIAPLVGYSLRRDGLATTLTRLDRLRPRFQLPWMGAVDVPASERAAARALRATPPFRGQCLERALVQYALHGLAHRRARFVVGVRREASGDLGAHAWVEDKSYRPAHADGFNVLLTRDTA